MTQINRPTSISHMLLHNDHDRETVRMAIHSSKPPSVLLYGPPGTGKTTLMELMAVEAINSLDASVTDFEGAERTGDVIVMDQRTGYGVDALKHVEERAALLSLNQFDRRWLIIDEVDAIEARLTARVKTILDELQQRRGVQVFAATNHFDRVDPAIRNRFVPIHMNFFSDEAMLTWLADAVRRFQLPPLSQVQAVSMVTRSAGSMRSLYMELERYAFQCDSPPPPRPKLTVLPGGVS